jgi:hypothetical protein
MLSQLSYRPQVRLLKPFACSNPLPARTVGLLEYSMAAAYTTQWPTNPRERDYWWA